MVATALAAAVCLALALASARSTDLPTNLFLAVALGPAAWTALQVTPLPCGLVEALSPLSASRLREVHALFDLGPPALCTLARDPGVTREELIKALALACGMLACGMLAARGEQRVVFRAVAGSTVLMALVALGHFVAGAERVFGVYEPIELRNMRFVAPLINPNNLGGFLALGLPVLMGLAFEEESPRRRAALIGAMGVVAATALMTRSRGAAGAIALGPALYALLAFARTRGRPLFGGEARLPWLRYATPVGIVLVLGVAAWAWFDELEAEFKASGWDKLDLIAIAGRYALTVPWVGVGRGGFSSSFVNTITKEYRFDYAENLFVQWAVDWGLPVTIALTAGLAWLLVSAARQARSHARVGAVAAIGTVVAQNMVDLGLELLGPALVAACLLGACASFPRRKRAPAARARALRVLGGVLIASTALASVALARRLHDEHGPLIEQRLQEMIDHAPPQRIAATLQRGMLAHPSEPMLAILGAHDALKRRDPKAGRFINRGMLLAPGWAAPHVQAVHWLWNRGSSRQALLELRAAAELERSSINPVLCAIARHDPSGVIEVSAPRNADRAWFLEQVARCLPISSPHVIELDAELVRLDPKAHLPRVRIARRLMAAQRYAEAAEVADVARSLAPEDAHVATLAARARAADGKFDAAFQVLDDALNRGAAPALIYAEIAQVAAEAKDRPRLTEALDRLRGWVGANATALDQAYRLEADLETRLGNRGAALAAYEEAYRIAGNPSSLQGVAQTAEALGDLRRAYRAYAELCALGQEGQGACAQRDRLQGLNP